MKCSNIKKSEFVLSVCCVLLGNIPVLLNVLSGVEEWEYIFLCLIIVLDIAVIVFWCIKFRKNRKKQL